METGASQSPEGTHERVHVRQYPEVPRLVMRGKNASTSVPAKFVVFQVGDTGKPMMVKAK